MKEEPKQEILQLKTNEFSDLAFDYFGGKPNPKTPEQSKDLAYYRANAEEDYMKVPISVLRYITELEERMYSEEEVIKIVKKSRETGLTAEYLLLTEQFKKKCLN